MVRCALGELRTETDSVAVDSELLAELAPQGRGVVLTAVERAAGRRPETAVLLVAQQENPPVAIEGDDAGGGPHRERCHGAQSAVVLAVVLRAVEVRLR